MNTIKQYTIVDTTKLDDERTTITSEELANYTSINDATFRLGFKHAQYTRRLVIEGKLESVKVQLEHFQKWYISLDGIKSYLETTTTRGGTRRFLLRTNIENEAKIRAAIDALDIEYNLELSYQKKEDSES